LLINKPNDNINHIHWCYASAISLAYAFFHVAAIRFRCYSMVVVLAYIFIELLKSTYDIIYF